MHPFLFSSSQTSRSLSLWLLSRYVPDCYLFPLDHQPPESTLPTSFWGPQLVNVPCNNKPTNTYLEESYHPEPFFYIYLHTQIQISLFAYFCWRLLNLAETPTEFSSIPMRAERKIWGWWLALDWVAVKCAWSPYSLITFLPFSHDSESLFLRRSLLSFRANTLRMIVLSSPYSESVSSFWRNPLHRPETASCHYFKLHKMDSWTIDCFKAI